MRFARLLASSTLLAACADSPDAAPVAPPPPGLAPASLDRPDGPLDPAVAAAVAATGEARVVVSLRETFEPGAPVDRRRRAVDLQRRQLLADLGPDGFAPARSLAVTPALVGRLSSAGLARLRGHRDVLSIRLDVAISGGGESVDNAPPMGIPALQGEGGPTGKGQRIAVLDSGIDLTHPDLAPALVAQHCFTTGACPPGNTFEGDSALDEHGHGTNVTGIVLSRGSVAPRGFAPAAELVAVRVLDATNSGNLSDWLAGLDWVAANQDTLRVTAINASVKTNATYPGNCDADWPAVASVTALLASQGVPVFVCSGNAGHPDAISAPACNSNVIAVGATYTGDLGPQPSEAPTYHDLFGFTWPDCGDPASSVDTIACFTDRNEQLDLLLPGAVVTSTGLGNGQSTFRGTSQAAPAAAGLALLMRECAPDLSIAAMMEALTSTAHPVLDGRNGLTFPRVQGDQAVTAVCACAGQPDGHPCPGGACASGLCQPGSGGSGGSSSAGAAGGAGDGGSVSGSSGQPGSAGAAGSSAGGPGAGGTSGGGGAPAGGASAGGAPSSGGAGGASAGGPGAGAAGQGASAGGASGPSTTAEASCATAPAGGASGAGWALAAAAALAGRRRRR